LDFESLGDLAKILIPASVAWGATWLSNRRERRVWTEKREEEQQKFLASQSERLVLGWSEMTTQARAIITGLQTETIEAKTRAAMAEERATGLARELSEIRAKYDKALSDLETLRRRYVDKNGTAL
jgi:hypothetical protein